MVAEGRRPPSAEALPAPTGPPEGDRAAPRARRHHGCVQPDGRRSPDGPAGTLAALVKQLEQGGAPPAQRFWVHINDQPANPWDSAQGMGMTWSLHKVVGKAALVGSDTRTNAYQGDTPGDQKLPLLCVRKRDLPCPGGVEADFYHGWTGYELRLSRPVAGTELTSLEAANAIIQAEFGQGWELGEFHSPQGGWTWWGYWSEPDAEGR